MMKQLIVNVDGVNVTVEYDYYFNSIVDPASIVEGIVYKHTEIYFREHFDKLKLDNYRYVLCNVEEYEKYVLEAIAITFPTIDIESINAYVPFQVLHIDYETAIQTKYLRSAVNVKVPIKVRYQGSDVELLTHHVNSLAGKACKAKAVDSDGRLLYLDKPYTQDDFTVLTVSMTIDDDTLNKLENQDRDNFVVYEWMLATVLVMFLGPLPIVKAYIMQSYYRNVKALDDTPLIANLLAGWIYLGLLTISIGIQLGFILWLECSYYMTYLWFVLLGFIGGIANVILMMIFC